MGESQEVADGTMDVDEKEEGMPSIAVFLGDSRLWERATKESPAHLPFSSLPSSADFGTNL